MREILFRGKSVDDDEWDFGYLFDDGMADSDRIFIGGIVVEDYKGNADDRFDITGIDFCEVIPETVCQYTGLTDKNGRKIFEGDIVKGVAYSTDFVGYIVWIDAIAGFGVRHFNKHREPTAWENSSILKAIQRWKQPNEFQAEIIGNIFDNPELIGG